MLAKTLALSSFAGPIKAFDNDKMASCACHRVDVGYTVASIGSLAPMKLLYIKMASNMSVDGHCMSVSLMQQC